MAVPNRHLRSCTPERGPQKEDGPNQKDGIDRKLGKPASLAALPVRIDGTEKTDERYKTPMNLR